MLVRPVRFQSTAPTTNAYPSGSDWAPRSPGSGHLLVPRVSLANVGVSLAIVQVSLRSGSVEGSVRKAAVGAPQRWEPTPARWRGWLPCPTPRQRRRQAGADTTTNSQGRLSWLGHTGHQGAPLTGKRRAIACATTSLGGGGPQGCCARLARPVATPKRWKGVAVPGSAGIVPAAQQVVWRVRSRGGAASAPCAAAPSHARKCPRGLGPRGPVCGVSGPLRLVERRLNATS